MNKHIQAAEGMENKDEEFPSELRYDIASKSWVVIASGRSKRPETFKKKEDRLEKNDTKNCPFCDEANYIDKVEVIANGEPVDPEKELPKNWSVVSIPNKFPAFIPDDNLDKKDESGFYKSMNAVGYHEVIVTKDHKKSIAQMENEEVVDILTTYKRRYLDLMKRKHVNHISIFHNHGKKAGASIAHPHSQLATTPLADMEVNSTLENTRQYMEEKGSCLYCDIQKWDMKNKERLVYQNDAFLVLCPFASKVAFQTVITPKKHLSNFEKITPDLIYLLADALRVTLKKIYEGIGDPDYNFYLHTAPCDGQSHDYYHWHFTVMPKTSVFAGFELGAGMEISTIKPEKAAEYLRKI